MKRLGGFAILSLLLVPLVVHAQEETTPEATEGDILTIAVGETVSGELAAAERARYTLEVGEDTPVLNIFLDGSDDMDTVLRVYEEGSDEPLAENDDRGDGSLYSAVEGLEVNPGDVLIIEAGTYADLGAGQYRVRVAPPASVEDQGEIEIGDTVEGTFPANTRDRYTLNIEDTTALSISLEGDDAMDTYLRLYNDGDESPSVQNDNVSEDDLSSGFDALIVPGGTTLVIEAATYSDAGEGDYTLTVDEADIDRAAADEPVALGESTADELCDGADDTEEPARLQYFAPEDALDEGVDYGAVFCTEAGNFLLDLYEAEAPIATNSFVYLAENHFFDDTTFHRVIPDFVVQGGDPLGTGFGGPGYEFVNETDNDLTFGGIGVLGMANAGPDTNGSQFFITLGPVARLDGGYTIFGQVQSGMGWVFDIEERDPDAATEPGTALYKVIVITLPDEE